MNTVVDAKSIGYCDVCVMRSAHGEMRIADGRRRLPLPHTSKEEAGVDGDSIGLRAV